MSSVAFGEQDAHARARLYRAVWRWHFYAGLFVIPFLIVLATTGMIMVYGNSVETSLGRAHTVEAGGQRAALTAQARVAEDAVPGGSVRLAVIPDSVERAAVFVISANGQDIVVPVDPRGPRALEAIVKDQTWFYWASNIHGTLLLGDFGDRLLEIAAGLGIVLVLTGVYM